MFEIHWLAELDLHACLSWHSDIGGAIASLLDLEPRHGVGREPDADHHDDQGTGRRQEPSPHRHSRQSLDELAALDEQESHRCQHPREPQAEGHHQNHPQGRAVEGHSRDEKDER
jgi:hypothetical protein